MPIVPQKFNETHSKRILVTGSTGLLGSRLVPFLRYQGYNILAHSYSKDSDCNFDLSNTDLALKKLSEIKPDVVINLVGLTSVELCEKEVNKAYLLNTRTVENIVYWISSTKPDCHLVHISTDHVYDGIGVHSEDKVTLTNTYALSKYAGEISAKQVKSTILRTNFVGRSTVCYRESLTDWVFRMLSNKEKTEVLEDVYFSPLTISKLMEMIELVLIKKPLGIYNLGSHEGMSKADFDFIFANYLNLQTNTMKRILSNQASFLTAYRTKDMRMDVSKFENTLEVKLPKLIDLIKEVANEYK